MSRIGCIAGMLWIAASGAVLAQEAITQPLPRSEITVGKSYLEGTLIWGENTEVDLDIWGLSGQLMVPIDARMAFNGKLTWLTDNDSGGSIDTITIGGAIAYELIEPAAGTPSLTIFGGAGVSWVEVKSGGVTLVDDTAVYVESGVQIDLKLSEDARVIPFFGVTFVFNGDSDTIFGAGGKVQVKIGEGWHFTGGAIFQFDDISEGWLLLVGVVKELGL
ncbi:MAG TPA: hypothetical protein VI643_03075 [Planctomycetota bacterium]|nr:hypothetical protein [Planctomycetota bacterium]